MKNAGIRITTIIIFLLLAWTIYKMEVDTAPFDQLCLIFIVLLLGLQIFKE